MKIQDKGRSPRPRGLSRVKGQMRGINKSPRQGATERTIGFKTDRFKGGKVPGDTYEGITSQKSHLDTLRDCRDRMLRYDLLEAAAYYADKVTSISGRQILTQR